MIETIENDKYKLSINYDDQACLEDVLFTDREAFYTNVPRYLGNYNTDNKTLDDFESMHEIVDYYGKDFKAYMVNASIHSGIALSLGNEYPFNCRFDSGLGGVLVLPKEVHADSFIKEFNSFLNGEVYYYTLEKKIKCKHCNEVKLETLDTYGFILGWGNLKARVLDCIELDDSEFISLIEGSL
jgi:hypothetical protein